MRLIELLLRTDIVRLSAATLLSRAYMVAVAPVVGGQNVGERGCESAILCVHAIADSGTELNGIHENSRYCAGGDIDDIIDGPAALRDSRGRAAARPSRARPGSGTVPPGPLAHTSSAAV
jgi:hypothetical protein